MDPVFRIDLDSLLNSKGPVVLELGCGSDKRAGRIGIDRLALPAVDIVADLEQGLPFFPDNSVDAIYSKSLLEHIRKLDFLMKEVWRILKPGAKAHFFVPHFSNPYYYSDPTHERFFGLYTFEYFSKSQRRFTRQVPDFYYDFSFRTESLKLEFRSPWHNRAKLNRIAQKLFNISPWWQEFYEGNLCYLFPCYGISATVVPEK